jgi:rhodanese-related sulfurtransferase
MSANLISLDDFKSLLNSGKTLNLLDVRTPGEYAHLHAAGVKLMPLDELNAAAIAEQHRNDAEPIYVICQSGGRAAKACERLKEAGVAQVFSVEGGTAAWEKAGLPVVRGGGKVISLERQVRIAVGTLVVIGSVLGLVIHRGFFSIPLFVGSGLVFAGVTDFCGMGILLSKLPWNRSGRRLG